MSFDFYQIKHRSLSSVVQQNVLCLFRSSFNSLFISVYIYKLFHLFVLHGFNV